MFFHFPTKGCKFSHSITEEMRTSKDLSDQMIQIKQQYQAKAINTDTTPENRNPNKDQSTDMGRPCKCAPATGCYPDRGICQHTTPGINSTKEIQKIHMASVDKGEYPMTQQQCTSMQQIPITSLPTFNGSTDHKSFSTQSAEDMTNQHENRNVNTPLDKEYTYRCDGD